MRRLQLTVPGRWYLALTIALGVVALSSGNNALYLVESLLLSGLILSGILSERAISAVHVEIIRRPSTAGSPSRDQIHVKNLKRYTAFCLEIGEWKDGKFTHVAYIPRIGGKQHLILPSRQVFPKRGKHTWDGFAIATSYPFGFARKIKLIKRKEERLIWPAGLTEGDERLSRAAGAARNLGGEISEGEIRPFTSEDDYRLIIWPLSAKGSEPLVRMRRSEQEGQELTLDLRTDGGEAFEANVRQIAHRFHAIGSSKSMAQDNSGLVLVDWNGRRKFRGKIQVLNQLAQVQPSGSSPREPSAA